MNDPIAPIVANDTASDQDKATVVFAFANAQLRTVLRSIIRRAAVDQDIEPEVDLVASLVEEWQHSFDPMILPDGTLGLQIRGDHDLTVEELMAFMVRKHSDNNQPATQPDVPCQSRPKKSRPPRRTK